MTNARFTALEVGVYDYLGGARLVSPLHLPEAYANLVDLHESVHKYLASSNLSDGIGRLLTVVLIDHADILSSIHRESITDLLQTINNNTALTHEVVATYDSFRAFAHTDFGRASYIEARKQLPREYEHFLRIGEKAFGPIEKVSYGKSPVGPILYASAVAALNLDYKSSLVTLESLNQLCNMVAHDAPDSRFNKILEVVRYDKPAPLLSDLVASYDFYADPDEFQRLIHERIRSKLPKLLFTRKVERPRFMFDALAALMESFARNGYTFASNFSMVAASKEDEDRPTYRHGSRSVNPNIPYNLAQDASLFSKAYHQISLTMMATEIKNSQREDVIIFAHVFAIGNQGELLQIHAYAEGSSTFAPCAAKCSISEWEAIFRDTEMARVVVKVDWKIGDDNINRFARLGSPTFAFIDGPAEEVVAAIHRFGKDKNIGCFRIRLKSDEYNAVIFVIPDTIFSVVWLGTAVGMKALETELLDSINWFQIKARPDEISSAVRLKFDSLCRMIFGWVWGTE